MASEACSVGYSEKTEVSNHNMRIPDGSISRDSSISHYFIFLNYGK